MRRITLLTTGLALGGAEGQVVLLAQNLKLRGWAVEVVSMLPPEAREEDLSTAGIPLYVLGMRRGVPDPRAILRLLRQQRRFRPHVVHCHMIHANLLGRVARMFASCPVLISTAHSIDEGAGWRNWAYRVTDFLSDVTSNVSRLGKDRYVRHRLVNSQRAVWVPNGIDVKVYHVPEGSREKSRTALGWGDEFVWLAVGNLREPKDYPNMIRAFQSLRAVSSGNRLAIVGCGSLEPQLKEQVVRENLSDCVEFLGRRFDVPQLLAAADGYLMSSAWEGTPMALLEACASGLPVVATAVGGNSEIIEAGRTGLLVPPHDSTALASGMTEILGMNPLDRRRMGELARRRVESLYGHEVVLNRWENIYRHLLESHYASRAQRARSGRLPRSNSL